MKSNTLLIVALILTIAAFFAIYHFKTSENIDKVDTVLITDTIWKNDTLTLFKEKPMLKIVKVTKVDTFYTSEGKDTILKTQSKLYQDTLCNKKDSIILKSYISGVNPSLDSISAEWRKSEATITNTIEVTKYIQKKRKFWDRLSIGPSVTAGYDPINKNFGTTVGFGVFFDIK